MLDTRTIRGGQSAHGGGTNPLLPLVSHMASQANPLLKSLLSQDNNINSKNEKISNKSKIKVEQKTHKKKILIIFKVVTFSCVGWILFFVGMMMRCVRVSLL